MSSHGVNTFVWVNSSGKRTFVKYHVTSNQAPSTFSNEEALSLTASDKDYDRRHLINSINAGNFSSWDLSVIIDS